MGRGGGGGAPGAEVGFPRPPLGFSAHSPAALPPPALWTSAGAEGGPWVHGLRRSCLLPSACAVANPPRAATGRSGVTTLHRRRGDSQAPRSWQATLFLSFASFPADAACALGNSRGASGVLDGPSGFLQASGLDPALIFSSGQAALVTLLHVQGRINHPEDWA